MEAKYVLIVEDNPDDLVLIKRVFKRYNIVNKIVVASDGAKALEILNGFDSKSSIKVNQLPALIILDLKLPKISGLELLEIIRNKKETKYIPVVIMTSSKEDIDIISSYKLGANSYVRKPIVFDEFAEAVRQVGLYWILLNESLPEIG